MEKAAFVPYFSAVLNTAITAYKGYKLSKPQADELAKYIHMSDRSLAINAIRDGVILNTFSEVPKSLTDLEMADFIKNKFEKTPEELGAIYRKLYQQLQQAGQTSAGAAQRIGTAGRRFVKLIYDKLFGS